MRVSEQIIAKQLWQVLNFKIDSKLSYFTVYDMILQTRYKLNLISMISTVTLDHWVAMEKKENTHAWEWVII